MSVPRASSKRNVEEVHDPQDQIVNQKKTCQEPIPKTIWNNYCRKILENIINVDPLPEYIDRNSFSFDKTQINRFTLSKKGKAFEFCKKFFPWFLDPPPARYREILALKSESGYTLDEVIDAMNYFFRRKFTSEDVAILREIYENMEPPTSGYLKPIVSVYRKFTDKNPNQQTIQTIENEVDAPVTVAAGVVDHRTIKEVIKISSMIEQNCVDIGGFRAQMMREMPSSDIEDLESPPAVHWQLGLDPDPMTTLLNLIQEKNATNEHLRAERQRLLATLCSSDHGGDVIPAPLCSVGESEESI